MRKAGVVLALLVLLAGVVRYVGDVDLRIDPLRIPLRPLAPSPDLRPSARVPAAPGSLSGYNLVLVTLDTTRPDRLGCYGNRQVETPNLDRLATDGVLFANAVATTATTLPSHASIFTGLYPHHHGARGNSTFALGDEQETLAEVLAGHGYDTAAFVSSFVLESRFGLGQGFAHYDDRSRGASMRFGFRERSAAETSERAIAWLGSSRARPFFLWVHYFDPHASYRPPAPFDERHTTPYDGEIAFADAQLGRLLEAVDAAAGAPTLVAVTADHGESLGEHGESTHGMLVQEATLRIPLILFAAGGLPGGVRVEPRVSQIDLMPTLLSLLGIAAPDGLDGVDLTSAPDPARPLLAEAVTGHVNYGWAPLAALYRGPLKYVDGPRPELYDLARDPVERVDLSSRRRREAAELRRSLRELRGPGADRIDRSDVALSAEELEGLQALGYLVNPAAGEAVGGDVGPDPKRMLPLWNELTRLIEGPELYAALPRWQRPLARLTGNALPADDAELIREIEKLGAANPDFAPAFRVLTSLHRRENQPERARDAQQRMERAIAGHSPPARP